MRNASRPSWESRTSNTGKGISVLGARERFDVIECSGVLHHIAQPLEAAMLALPCKPGGRMRIGLQA